MYRPLSHSRWLVTLTVLLGGLSGLIVLTPGAGTARPPAPENKIDPTVAAGLKWLALHQAADGHWGLNDFNRHAHEEALKGAPFTCDCSGMGSVNNDVASTALALLPFLGAGITHKSAEQQPVYSKTVNAGLTFLMSKQGRDGSFHTLSYAHALATMALCNAFGMTADPKLKAPAQRAASFIVQAQDPQGGGWRYQPRQAGDLSVTAWEIQALKSAQLAGLDVPAACLRKGGTFIDSCEVNNQGRLEGFSYVPAVPASDSMTAAGLLSRLYLGANPRNLGAGLDRLQKVPPAASNNYYYLYYATQVMHHAGGDAWDLWNKGRKGQPGLRERLLQEVDAGKNAQHSHQKGSWEARPEGHITQGGRIMATSLALLMLEMSDRQLPLFRKEMPEKEKP